MRLGFVVEGDSDVEVLERLVPRLVNGAVERFHFVRLGGRAALSSAYTSALVLLAKGYEHVIFVFDTDSVLPAVVEDLVSRLDDSMREHGLTGRVSLCPAVPTIEGWILAGLPGHDATSPDPKRALSHVLGVGQLRPCDLASSTDSMDLELAERRSPSFAAFALTLRTVAGAAAGAEP